MDGPVPSPRRSARTVAVVVAAFMLGIVVGFGSRGPATPIRSLNEAIQQLTDRGARADFALLTQAWDLIQSKFVKRPIDEEQLVRGAVNGLVQSLDDPYSFYLDPSDSSSFEDELNGKFEGIGAELGYKEGKIVIIAPLPGTPAEQSGIRPGDTILGIDDESTEQMTLEQTVSKIRGKEGTTVKLLIQRDAEPPLTVSVKRARIQIKSVSLAYREVMARTLAIVRISSFTQRTEQEFKQTVGSLLAKQPAGIVFDLRNNPGGYLSAAVSVADAFLKSGPLVVEDFGSGKREQTDADSAAPLESFHVVALINGGSASAAEILAGALQDRLSAPVVGETSFGKGSVQEIENLSDGSTVKLTVAHWLTPNGRAIDGKGIEPTEVVKLSDDDRAAGRDPQLDRALELLSR